MDLDNPTGSRRKEVTTRMPPDLADALKRVAEAQGLTVNAYVVAVLAQAVEHEGQLLIDAGLGLNQTLAAIRAQLDRLATALPADEAPAEEVMAKAS